MRKSLAQRMTGEGYDGYAYAYPHKTAYRPLDPPIPLREAWRDEHKENFFLYTHLPFCEMRCGFCNLFTTAKPGASLVDNTMQAIMRQSAVVAREIDPGGISQAAFGGGTPSFLNENEIKALFTELANSWPVNWNSIPVSFEVSPGTITPDKLGLIKSLGVDRISMGAQSFVPEDLIAMKRPQPAGELERACDMIKSASFPVFNLDLIYGAEGQNASHWLESLKRALEWHPEEIYIYPLYVRELTNLQRCGKRPAEHRRELGRIAQDFLLQNGYHQISMRLFRRADVSRATDYCCQDDGMIGLGPGARSYTRRLHYSSEYAVSQTEVKSIIGDFNGKTNAQFGTADFGVFLNDEELRRRYLIKSLLRVEGLDRKAYHSEFGRSVEDDFPELSQLEGLGLIDPNKDLFMLNSDGIMWSDVIGPWLYSDSVSGEMEECELV